MSFSCKMYLRNWTLLIVQKQFNARVLKNNMTKEEFTAWAKDAEKLRDKALSEYELVQDDDRLWIIAKLKQDLNEK